MFLRMEIAIIMLPHKASQVALVVGNLLANAGDVGLIPASGSSPAVFLPGEFHGQRRLVGYSPEGRKELDTAETT